MAARVIGRTRVALCLAMAAVSAIVDGQAPNPQVVAPRDSAPPAARPGSQSATGIGVENANFSLPELRDLQARVKTSAR